MSRHLADKRVPSTGRRAQEFLRMARAEGSQFWAGFWRRPRATGEGNRRMAQYLRIDREQPGDRQA